MSPQCCAQGSEIKSNMPFLDLAMPWPIAQDAFPLEAQHRTDSVSGELSRVGMDPGAWTFCASLPILAAQLRPPGSKAHSSSLNTAKATCSIG